MVHHSLLEANALRMGQCLDVTRQCSLQTSIAALPLNASLLCFELAHEGAASLHFSF